jgi:hypothetical protein
VIFFLKTPGFLVGTNPGLGLITDWTVEWKNF